MKIKRIIRRYVWGLPDEEETPIKEDIDWKSHVGKNIIGNLRLAKDTSVDMHEFSVVNVSDKGFVKLTFIRAGKTYGGWWPPSDIELIDSIEEIQT